MKNKTISYVNLQRVKMGDKRSERRMFVDDNFIIYTMTCPQCKKKMEHKTIAYVNIWECYDCRLEIIKR